MAPQKPVNSLVIDAGPIIKNSPPVSTLIAQAESLYTIPAVVSEIRDEVTRARVETTLLPFLTQRNPRPETVKIVQDFARRTGDLQVLSATDIQLIALAREIECERNGGDWRLRNAPGQKGTNGKPPGKSVEKKSPASGKEQIKGEEESAQPAENQESSKTAAADAPAPAEPDATDAVTSALEHTHISDASQSAEKNETQEPKTAAEAAQPEQSTPETSQPADQHETAPMEEDAENPAEDQAADDSDSDGWITPSNIKRKQQEDDKAGAGSGPEPRHMQAAIMTTDFAMQNVILQMGLNLLSPALQRIKQVKSYILRCYACFLTTKQMDKQFCPRCGKPSLTRVSCSTSANGEFKLHLKKNFQINNRGERYSIPKPATKSASGRVTSGGGAQGWGADLILTEDQREYQRAMGEIKRQKQRDLMDEDYLPGILTGERNKAGGRPKVGAGRNVNSRRRN
ncbi:Nin one binding Zn-ribbon like-domain-containing protein [Phyllosticta citriasiana]|uniref:20S-pre-rRNA D-site endonuclease NOB1 n=1 Tax=Phyllosticta citriasiana TaxID=595635 RepID=A0ABR1K9W5_9PEZI